MAAKITCSVCKKVFEDEVIQPPRQPSLTDAAVGFREIVRHCPFCGKPTWVRVRKDQVRDHPIDRGMS